jgi:K+ transporter
VLLATVATIIASQAIITGSFSLTRQAMQLGWFPGLRIRQTSDEEYGHIYVPFVNWTMMLFPIALTVGYGRSDRLAGAYGTAVSTTMLLTTALIYKLMRDRWGWSATSALLTSGVFLIVDFAFFAPNLKSSRVADPAHLRRDRVHCHDDMAFRHRGQPAQACDHDRAARTIPRTARSEQDSACRARPSF